MTLAGNDYAYFMNAYNSPNAAYMQYLAAMDKQAAAQGTTAANASTPTAATTPESIFEEPKTTAVTPAVEEPKSSNSTALFLGSVAALSATALCLVAHKKGVGEGTWAKVGDGLKKIFHIGGKDAAAEAGKLTHTVKEFSINDKNLCRVPGRHNRISGDAANIQAELQKIGVDAAAPTSLVRTIGGKPALEEGIKLREYTFTVGTGNKAKVFKVKNNKIVSCKDNSGTELISKFRTAEKTKNFGKTGSTREEIEKMVTGFQKGENLGNVSNLKYSHTADGTTRVFDQSGNIQYAVSDWHALDSDAVNAYRGRNSAIDEMIKKHLKGEDGALKMVEAEYIHPTLGTFTLKNGELNGIKIGGTYYPKGSDKFESLCYQNKDVFAQIPKEKTGYSNIIYQAA